MAVDTETVSLVMQHVPCSSGEDYIRSRRKQTPQQVWDRCRNPSYMIWWLNEIWVNTEETRRIPKNTDRFLANMYITRDIIALYKPNHLPVLGMLDRWIDLDMYPEPGEWSRFADISLELPGRSFRTIKESLEGQLIGETDYDGSYLGRAISGTTICNIIRKHVPKVPLGSE